MIDDDLICRLSVLIYSFLIPCSSPPLTLLSLFLGLLVSVRADFWPRFETSLSQGLSQEVKHTCIVWSSRIGPHTCSPWTQCDSADLFVFSAQYISISIQMNSERIMVFFILFKNAYYFLTLLLGSVYIANKLVGSFKAVWHWPAFTTKMNQGSSQMAKK